MKFANNLLKIILLLCIISNEIICLSIRESLSLSSSECSIKEKGSVRYAEWVKEVKNKMSASISGIPDCMSPSQCRTYEEMIFIAYCKSRQLARLLKKEMFVVSVDKNLQTFGVSRFLMILGGRANVGQEMMASTLFKLCIPTNRIKWAYGIYECPLSDCEQDYEVAKKCSKRKFIPKNEIDFTKIKTS